MQQLIKEYRQSLKEIRKLKEAAEKYDQKIYAGMITDLEIAINWMETGRPPGNKKGVYGTPGSAMSFDPIWFGSMGQDRLLQTPLDPFEEVENRIDKERRARKRA